MHKPTPSPYPSAPASNADKTDTGQWTVSSFNVEDANDLLLAITPMIVRSSNVLTALSTNLDIRELNAQLEEYAEEDPPGPSTTVILVRDPSLSCNKLAKDVYTDLVFGY